jgi:hypothetical protein
VRPSQDLELATTFPPWSATSLANTTRDSQLGLEILIFTLARVSEATSYHNLKTNKDVAGHGSNGLKEFDR